MKLEHAHGYAGLNNLSTNLFYTANPSEVVYYVAGTGAGAYTRPLVGST